MLNAKSILSLSIFIIFKLIYTVSTFSRTRHHITHIVIRTGITSREWNIYEAEHIGSLATEVLDATRDAVLEEFKLDTRIEVAVGLPGNIRITHGVLHETYLAIEVAEIISIVYR